MAFGTTEQKKTKKPEVKKPVKVDTMLAGAIVQAKEDLRLAVSRRSGTRHNLARRLEALQKQAE